MLASRHAHASPTHGTPCRGRASTAAGVASSVRHYSRYLFCVPFCLRTCANLDAALHYRYLVDDRPVCPIRQLIN
jgi:hypothetical protein